MYIWFVTKREVKMAGYWLSYFFVCLWTEAVLRSINMQKRRLMSSYLDPTSVVNKRFIAWNKITIFLWGTAINPKWAS